MRKLIIILILATGVIACKHKDTPAPSCPTHEVRTGDSCNCDSLSIKYNGHCQFLGHLLKGNAIYGVAHSDCKDWKDSILIYCDSTQEIQYWSSDSRGLLGNFDFHWFSTEDPTGISGNSGGSSACYYKIGSQYDTLTFYAQEFLAGKHTGFYNWHLAMNKKRDTILAIFCDAPPNSYTSAYCADLDSCFLTFVRLN